MPTSTHDRCLSLSARVRRWRIRAAGLGIALLGIAAWSWIDEKATRQQIIDVRAAFERDGFADITVERAVGLWARRSVDVSVSGNVERMSQQTSDLLAASGHVKLVVVRDEVRVFPDIKTPRGFICTGSLGACCFQRLGR